MIDYSVLDGGNVITIDPLVHGGEPQLLFCCQRFCQILIYSSSCTRSARIREIL